MHWKQPARRPAQTLTNERRTDAGFTLLETIVALAILMVGLLGLAQVFALGVRYMSTSTYDMIAREKAREAVESVHTARDAGTVVWSQVKNVANGGVFLDAETTLKKPGPDGLVNTADDLTTLEEQTLPGPDGILGNTDDVHQPINNFWRTIAITDVADSCSIATGLCTLRQLKVTIRYQVGTATRTYTLVTYVSSYS